MAVSRDDIEYLLDKIYKMVNEGRFPKQVKLSERASAWRMSEVLIWQEGLRS